MMEDWEIDGLVEVKCCNAHESAYNPLAWTCPMPVVPSDLGGRWWVGHHQYRWSRIRLHMQLESLLREEILES